MACDLGIRSLNWGRYGTVGSNVADLAVGSHICPFQLFSSSKSFDISRRHWSPPSAPLHPQVPLFLFFFCLFVLLSVISTDVVSKNCNWDRLVYPAYVMVIGCVVDSAKP
jgi:hypothetical protein